MSGAAGAIVHFLYEPSAGGLDRVAILLANEMAERGTRTELWLTRTEGPLSNLISEQVTVRIVPTAKFGERGLRLFWQIPSLARLIRQHRPAAIFSAGNQSNLSVALAKKLSGVTKTLVIQKITNPVVRPKMSALSARLRALRFEQTSLLGDATLALSKQDSDELKQLLPRAKERIFPVKNAYISDAMIKRGRARPARVINGPKRMLAVGRLSAQKDHATLLHALGRLPEHVWVLDILGDGELRDELTRLVRQMGIEKRVTFHGFVEDPIGFYLRSDILVLPSLWEGLPAVPLEAMALGCQVIATDCSPGLTQILQACQQTIVPIADPSALAAAIGLALEQQGSQLEGAVAASQYSVSSAVDDHLAILAGLIGSTESQR